MECCPLPTKARFLRLCNRAPSGRQTSRPASACRLLLIHTSSNSSAYLSSVVHLELHRRARLLYRVSTLFHSIRASSQADRTICRNAFTSKLHQDNNRHHSLCGLIVLCLFLHGVRHLHLSFRRSHCRCEQSRPKPPPICHSAFLASLRRAPPDPR
jgi:hypothetical protein